MGMKSQMDCELTEETLRELMRIAAEDSERLGPPELIRYIGKNKEIPVLFSESAKSWY